MMTTSPSSSQLPIIISSHDATEAETPTATHVPLSLADASATAESTSVHELDSHDSFSEEDLQYGVWLSTLLGAALGFLAPFFALCTAMFISYVTAPKVQLPFNVVWSFVVLSVVIAAQQAFYKTLRSSRHPQDEITEDAVEVVKLRFGLGAMMGLLVSWCLTCLILGFSFWDRVGLISGSVIVFFYSETRAARVSEEDFRVQKIEDPIVGVLSV